MDEPQANPVRRRRRWPIVALVLVFAGSLWLSSDQSRFSSADFWSYLEQHPALAACIRPFYALVGRENQFALQLNAPRRARESAERQHKDAEKSGALRQKWNRMLEEAKAQDRP